MLSIFSGCCWFISTAQLIKYWQLEFFMWIRDWEILFNVYITHFIPSHCSLVVVTAIVMPPTAEWWESSAMEIWHEVSAADRLGHGLDNRADKDECMPEILCPNLPLHMSFVTFHISLRFFLLQQFSVLACKNPQLWTTCSPSSIWAWSRTWPSRACSV